MKNSKNKDIWYRMLRHFRCRIRFNPESIQRMVARTAFYTFLRNPNGNRYVLCLYWNDSRWNWNYNWLENDWNINNPSAILAIFTRHIDKEQEAFSWSIESTGIGLAAGFAAAFGGVIAVSLGFKTVFILVAAFGLMASSSLILIKNQMYAKDNFVIKSPPKEKPF